MRLRKLGDQSVITPGGGGVDEKSWRISLPPWSWAPPLFLEIQISKCFSFVLIYKKVYIQFNAFYS